MSRPARNVPETVEDLTFLVEHRVGAVDAARRLGFPSADALEKWLRDHQLSGFWVQLRAHDPLPLRGPVAEHQLRRAG